MTHIDYEAYARDLNIWYNNVEFYDVRTAADLCKIFDCCKFSTNQFIQIFTIINKKFNSSEVIAISQHARIQTFENGEKAFDALNFISKLLNNKAISDATTYIKDHTAQTGKNIKYLMKCSLYRDDFFQIFKILSKACKDGDTYTLKYAVTEGYINIYTYYSEKSNLFYLNSEPEEARPYSLFEYILSKNNMELFRQLSIFSNICTSNSLESIKCLYTQLNEDVNSRDGFQKTLLHYAALNEDVEVTKYFVSFQSIDINAKDDCQATPMHYAAFNRNVEVIKYLCSLPGIDIKVKDAKEKTPLHYAVLVKNSEVVKYLCSLPNIDINAIDSNKKSALHYAAENDSIEIIRYISEHMK
ncbi:hypothetical protein TVAG_065840 [Trichomonas vaginalis G3]|uniref:Uncharacterized protein n=1 Tax=Trichomonas vaginalis (strain ATCC PRA-98 / G3) TaxID=412133 RepID=A2ELY8_TRIV3|nr:protein ubiquitination [Trichomonas vaginalis G3]EAY06327.1 hypothetical protein TVAG_065840 [Trichomonas vaginalis G3]KAI5489863.1 protein ubiquitination [Trichomonas vaginalis G3]|eukprot:XP_001318550.1 hypothetical protein [Trichomonas vaginalis G3]